MSAYAATVTLSAPKVSKLAGTNQGFISGLVHVSNYNSVLVTLHDITNKFRGPFVVVAAGATDEGFLVAWDAGHSSFKAFAPGAAGGTPEGTITMDSYTPAGTNNGDSPPLFAGTPHVLTGIFAGDALVAGDPMAEVANDVDVGTVSFFAIGIV